MFDWLRKKPKDNGDRITIAQLTPAQLARHAFNVFLFGGRHQTGAKLIYHALTIEPYEPEALRCLSDFLDSKDTEVFSGIVLEYALAPDSPLTPSERTVLDDLRFLAKWSWEFSRHRSGERHLPGEAFKDRSQFIVDEERYLAFLQQALPPDGSFRTGFVAAHTLVGAMSGLITHQQFGAAAPFAELLHPDRFHQTDAYAQWLSSDTAELDALEKSRQERSANK